MRIRPTTEDDAAAVTALWTEAYTGRGPGGRRTPYEQSEFFASARLGQMFVAEEEAALVGVIVFYPPTAPGRTVAGEGEAEHSRLAVSGAARGRGIGRALAALCVELAREAGAEAIVLWSRPYQVEAHRLYESLGYRRAHERDSEDADGSRLVFVLDVLADR
ncbi:MAG: GNAT family N-acetyltransferase [Solirubrobacterales bacterium]